MAQNLTDSADSGSDLYSGLYSDPGYLCSDHYSGPADLYFGPDSDPDSAGPDSAGPDSADPDSADPDSGPDSDHSAGSAADPAAASTSL